MAAQEAVIRHEGGKPPTRIEYRYCPTSEFHWKVDGERCPVCKAKIATQVYVAASGEQEPS